MWPIPKSDLSILGTNQLLMQFDETFLSRKCVFNEVIFHIIRKFSSELISNHKLGCIHSSTVPQAKQKRISGNKKRHESVVLSVPLLGKPTAGEIGLGIWPWGLQRQENEIWEGHIF